MSYTCVIIIIALMSVFMAESCKPSGRSSSTVTRQSISKPRCQEGDAYYPKKGQCYGLYPPARSPCDPLMKFQISATDPSRGYVEGNCVCKASECLGGRQIGYFSATGRCYYDFDQGPCAEEEWLVPSQVSGQLHCEEYSCGWLRDHVNGYEQHNLEVHPEEQVFLFIHAGRCFIQGVTYKEYNCGPGEKLWYNGREKPICSQFLRCVGHTLAHISAISCGNGKARDPAGGCSPLADASDYDY